MSSFLTKPLVFSSSSTKPIFFASYVTTLDGKIFVKSPGYWPIGSKTDYEYFTFLRAHADVIVDGKNTALAFGSHTLKTIHSERFLSYRKMIGKENQVKYMILSRNLDNELTNILDNEYGYIPTIITSSDSLDENNIGSLATIERLPITRAENIVASFIDYVAEKRYQRIFLDLGPALLSECIKVSALDELFLTISPKMFGSSNETISLGDFPLFQPDDIPKFSLISSESVGDETFLRYRLRKE